MFTLLVVMCVIYTAASLKSADDFKVTALNKYQSELDVTYAGMMPLKQPAEDGHDHGEFFFWLAEARSRAKSSHTADDGGDKSSAPLIIWLNGKYGILCYV